MTRPAFQHQGPSSNCVIADRELGWTSCTAYAMAMLIDAATDGRLRPKGCKVRRLVRPEDTIKGLTLGQVATVAEKTYGVPIALRTGPNVISVESAARRIRAGRGFVLQGNNLAWGMGDVNHAVYVHEVRGGTDEAPAEGLLFDPQRQHERWLAWSKLVAFGAALRMDSGRPLGGGVLYAGFAPRPSGDDEAATHPAGAPAAMAADRVPAPPKVILRFHGKRLKKPDRTVAHPPRGRVVNVRKRPNSLTRSTVVDTLARGEVFVACQWARGAIPPGAASAVWYGNRDGTQWIHVSGLRAFDPSLRPRAGGGLGVAPLPSPVELPDPDLEAVDVPAALDPGDPGAGPAASDALEEAPGSDDLNPEIPNDSIEPGGGVATPAPGGGVGAPAAAGAVGDAGPPGDDDAFTGRPLTDAEIEALGAGDMDDDPGP